MTEIFTLGINLSPNVIAVLTSFEPPAVVYNGDALTGRVPQRRNSNTLTPTLGLNKTCSFFKLPSSESSPGGQLSPAASFGWFRFVSVKQLFTRTGKRDRAYHSGSNESDYGRTR